MGKEKKRLIESMLLRRRHRCTPNTHPAPNTLQKRYLSSKILKLCIIIIIIIIAIIIIIFALGFICAVSAGGRTRSHLDWLKSSSRPKSRTHFAFSKFTQIVFCVFATILLKHIVSKKVSSICLCNETFCAHKCIFSAQDCNSFADIPKARVAAAGTVFSSS